MNAQWQSYFDSISDPQRLRDIKSLIQLMQEASGYEPYLTGSIVGYGRYDVPLSSGAVSQRIVTGFASRKRNITIYLMSGFEPFADDLQRLGKAKTSQKCCLYINRLSDVDTKILQTLIRRSVKIIQSRWDCSA